MKRFPSMAVVRVLSACLLCALLMVGRSPAQVSAGTGRGEFRIRLDRRNDTTTIQLPHRFLEPGTDSLVLEGMRPLLRHSDYTIRYAAGLVTLRESLADSLLRDTSATVILLARYRYLPFRLSGTYARRTLTVLPDSSGADTVSVARTRASFGLDDIFGRDLQKSGSLIRGFTVGSNRDLSLTSGFRMQLSGTLGTDVEVAASLTDENTPIPPEGTTQTLQEFDNVFVEIRSKSFGATLGDFTLDLGGTEFARLTRKLQGARGTAMLQSEAVRGEALLAGAITRGKFHTNLFQGAEGVQGPYRLTGSGGERSIIVIAGTEKVYVDGEQQVRGETNDYVIDYATGEIRFTRRLITGASRITVDFEYTDRRFSRSLLGIQGGTSLLDSRGRLSVTFLREADDPDAPIDLVLSDSARRVLEAAGADPARAVLSGVIAVDSNGTYVRIDSTLADGSPVRFYRFNPGDSLALYIVTFSFVGSGRGEYIRRRPGEFEWNGPGGGDYLPVIFLPFARSHQLVDISATAAPVAGLTIGGEFARSELDLNRFSTRDGMIGGHALLFTAGFAPRGVPLLGDVDLNLRERFVDSRFFPLDRMNDIEFNRKWGIDSVAAVDEEIQEGRLSSTPVRGFTVGGVYGRIARGEQFRSVRNEGSVMLEREGLPRVRYFVESIRSRDRTSDQRSVWLRQKGMTSYAGSWVIPGFRFEAEDRTQRRFEGEAPLEGSFRFREFAPGLSFPGPGPLSFNAEYEWRIDDRASGGTFLREARSFTQAYGARLTEWNDLSSSLELTLRRRQSTPPFSTSGEGDIRSVLVRNQTRFTPLARAVDADLFYEVTTEAASQFERVFVRVAAGSGTHRYRGDLNGNGLADDEEFEPVRFDGDFVPVILTSDEIVPVIDLKTGLRLRVQPSRMSGIGETGMGALLRALGSETYVRIEEKSTEQDLRRIYLLDLSSFQREQTTIVGSALFTQDFLILEGQPLFSSRVRFSQRTGLTRFSSGNERSYSRERSIRLRWQLIPEIAGQLDLVNRLDRITAGESSPRSRDVTSDGLTMDLAYRPDQRVEAGLRLDLAHGADKVRIPALASDFNAQGLRLVVAFPGTGQVRLEASREEVILGSFVGQVPFELTGGRVAGKTWIWRLTMDYRMTEFIQAGLNYDGRTEGGRAAVHTARAEVRAFF